MDRAQAGLQPGYVADHWPPVPIPLFCAIAARPVSLRNLIFTSTKTSPFGARKH